VITPRTTRLVRVADLEAFRDAAVALATAGEPFAARDRLVVVPTRAASIHLLRTIEDRLLPENGALLLPDLVTPSEIVDAFAARLPDGPPALSAPEREVLLGAACRAVAAGGVEPPFGLRPGLVAEALRFYDELRARQKEVDTFERLTLGALEPGAAYDRGAERLVRQTRFLVAAFREFEARSRDAGTDQHALRARIVRETAARPIADVVLTVTDRASDPHGLMPADWDLLTRVPGLEQLTILVTDGALAGTLHERLHTLLPGIEEVRFAIDEGGHSSPRLLPPELHVARDREEEVAQFARRVKAVARRDDAPSLDRFALVVRQRLPYVYVAREVLRSAGIPSQTVDSLPLAAEPYAAAADLVLSLVSSNFARGASVALLRSPHFWRHDVAGNALDPADVDALDRALGEAGYLGDADALSRLIESWRKASPERGRASRALRAAGPLQAIVAELLPLRSAAPVAEHLQRLIAFLTQPGRSGAGHGDGGHAASRPTGSGRLLPRPTEESAVDERERRARAAVLGTLAALRDAHARFDATPMEFDDLAALVRRWIDSHTFAPRAGERGVHIVDADSARFGAFDEVQLAGLVDGEWPERPRHNIFYSTSLLRELGWPLEKERLDGARAAFADLLRLPRTVVSASTFSLEADALVSPSPFVDEIAKAELPVLDEAAPPVREFDYELLGDEPASRPERDARGWMIDRGLEPDVRAWAKRRLAALPGDDPAFHGQTQPHRPEAYSLSALERYQDCPFKYFAADVLRLEEPVEDEPSLSPRARGRFIHEVFERFFQAWDAGGFGTISPDRMDEARTLFASIAEPLLARLPDSDAALERTRLFGSAISVGIVDVVLGLEASRPVAVEERWLEYRLKGEFSLAPDEDDRRVRLIGVADRIDLMRGRKLRVIDYKSGQAPNPKRALQVAIYALCAQERLGERDGAPWAVDEATYVSFSGRRPLAPVVKRGEKDGREALLDARERLFTVVQGVETGTFPPRPEEVSICRYCAYSTVCRKDYVDA
jgi:RecB family exonuclease/inactivated superfamily I helicase